MCAGGLNFMGAALTAGTLIGSKGGSVGIESMWFSCVSCNSMGVLEIEAAREEDGEGVALLMS